LKKGADLRNKLGNFMSSKLNYASPTWKNYIWQPLMIIVFLTCVLSVFFLIESTVSVVWAVGVGSLASTSYLVFAKPSATASHPFRFVISYVIAIVCGLLVHYLSEYFLLHGHGFLYLSVLAALSVVITMLLMIWLRLDHPPAVGMALVFVIDLKDYRTSIIVIGAVTIMMILKILLNPWLKDLI
jgi:CBS-domain-containing membrane protein